MTRTRMGIGFSLLTLLGMGCAHESPPAHVAPSTAVSEPVPTVAAEPAASVDARSPVEIAVAAELEALGITVTPTLAETLDVDGDGRDDALFHAGTDVGCVLARTTAEGVQVDVLPAGLGSAPGLTTCLPALRMPAGALLALSADNGMTQMRQGLLQLFSVAPGSPPAPVFQEMFPFVARYTLRAVDAESIEVVAAGADPALVPGEIRKHLRLGEAGQWVSASCWTEQATELVADAPTCSITLPETARERRLESHAGGPPVFAGDALVLAPGAPPRNSRGPRTWCVRFADGRSAWVELPRALTARCPANVGHPSVP